MARMMTLGDVMQATVLATLHLRSDLRTLGAFGALDSKSDSGGTPGDDLNLLIYLYRYMLMKANFRMVSFTSPHSAPRITCQRTLQAVSRQQTRITLSRGICTALSFFFSLMRSVTLSVAVGYYSVFLCVLPQLLTALLLGICKCIADKEFRRWTFGDKVLYPLIGSLVPMAIERSNTEDISRNAQEHLSRTEVTETLKSETEEHPEEVPMKVDAMIEEAEEVKMGDMVGEQTEGPNEFILTQRNTTKELCALFILHAASVILGAAFIAFLDETSSEYAVTRIKVREASGIDLHGMSYHSVGKHRFPRNPQ